MSNIEIKIAGINKRDIQISLTELAQAFGVQLEVDLAQVVNDADMTDLFELVKARFKAQGFDLIAESMADERPKRGRKPKLSQEEAKEALEVIEDPTPVYSEDELKALKAKTLSKVGVHWQNDAGRAAMTKILKEHGEGATLYRDTPETCFPNIANAVEAYENTL